MTYLLLILGLALLLLGANYLVDSSVALAQKAKISNFVIGLTIVGMGTSSPELFVSISSALHGAGDVALGNVIGSNICNILLILGLTAAIFPFDIERTTYRRDIPFAIAATLIVIVFTSDTLLFDGKNILSRTDAVVLLIVFALYMGYVVMKDRKSGEADEEECTSTLAGKKPILLIPIALLSLAALLFGGQMFLDSAQSLAKQWGMSDAVIAITIVAIGTSLPELITSVVAAIKHNPQLALGNAIGSNIFNLLFILGITGTIKPVEIQGINIIDYAVMTLAIILTFVVVFTFGKKRFDRIEGIIFLAIYIIYTIYLLQRI